jgi:hypothetical protein
MEPGAVQDYRQDDLHLPHREVRAETATRPAAEGDPAEGGGMAAEESLRPERVRVLEQVATMVDEVGSDGHDGAGRQHRAAQANRFHQEPHRVDHRRADAEGFLNHRVDVGAVSGSDCVPQAVEDRRMPQHEVDRPGHRTRRGLVADDEEGPQLVGDLAIVEWGGAGLLCEEKPERIGAVALPGSDAALRDLRPEEVVDRAAAAFEHLMGEPGLGGSQQCARSRLDGCCGQHAPQTSLQLACACVVQVTDRQARDDAEGDLPHRRHEREAPARGPRVHLAVRDACDPLAAGCETLRAEQREQAVSPVSVLVPV